MSKFYYLVKATNSENVGEIDAEDQNAAREQLNGIFAPPDPNTGKPHKGISVEIISEKDYKTNKKRIDEERKAEAVK